MTNVVHHVKVNEHQNNKPTQNCNKEQGPVVQSIVSLTSLL